MNLENVMTDDLNAPLQQPHAAEPYAPAVPHPSSFILHPSQRILQPQARKPRGQRGFTLIELIVVVTIIGVLASLAIVNVRYAQRKAREAALMDNLATMRKAIDNFYADKQRYPSSLSELAPNYVRRIPADPITKQTDWEEIMDDPYASSPDGGEPIPSETDPEAMTQPGVVDVKSRAVGSTMDNVPYSEL